jgi:hypothetical protein
VGRKGKSNKRKLYIFCYGERNVNHQRGTGYFVRNGIISAVKSVEFFSEMIPYITLNGRWCDIVILNVHAPNRNEDDTIKSSFSEEKEQVFDQFPR